MGNVAQESQQQAQTGNSKNLGTHRYCLQIRDREIIVSYRDKIKITIGDILSFPAGGFEGLHLWDSNVILARYILVNRLMFTGKSILELLSGTGLGAIAARKFTTAHSITATDRCHQVTNNIIKNCSKNNVEGIQVACITWAEYSKKQSKAKFNYIIGADLLFTGSPVDLLLSMFEKYLAPQGKVIMIIPFKNGHDSTANFALKLDPQAWTLRKEKLTDDIYMDSPLLNQVQGYEEFKQISESYFYLYILQRTKQIDRDFVEIKQHQPAVRKVVNFRKDQAKFQQEIQIKQQNMEEKNLTKQLDIVKVSKSEDRPEYERKKRKTITEIIAESEEAKTMKETRKDNETDSLTQEKAKLSEQVQKRSYDEVRDIQKQKEGLNNVE